MIKLEAKEDGINGEWTYGYNSETGRYGSAWPDGGVHMMGSGDKCIHKNTYNQAVRTLRAYLKGHRP